MAHFECPRIYWKSENESECLFFCFCRAEMQMRHEIHFFLCQTSDKKRLRKTQRTRWKKSRRGWTRRKRAFSFAINNTLRHQTNDSESERAKCIKKRCCRIIVINRNGCIIIIIKLWYFSKGNVSIHINKTSSRSLRDFRCRRQRMPPTAVAIHWRAFCCAHMNFIISRFSLDSWKRSKASEREDKPREQMKQ